MSVYDGYEVVIGLEVHCQLLTSSKLFCPCSTNFGAPPNHNTCPVCQGHPGVLPVLNRRVVEFAVRLGHALGFTINPRSEFSRKQYFYPDLPKGYQVSQYDRPILLGGALTFTGADDVERTVRITRAHMEEDAGKSIHAPEGGHSLLDFNRAGVPLLEIVSEPDLRSAEDAAAYLKELRAIVVALGICDGNMQEGSLRCDANVSVRRRGDSVLGTRVELKNINSFRFVTQAIHHEFRRQVDLLEDGKKVTQETRGYDAEAGTSHPLRSKEDAHDYRYFPDPDLLPVTLDDAWIAAQKAHVPELPRARAERFTREHGIAVRDARVLVEDRATADYFEAAARAHPANPRAVCNWIVNDVLRESGGVLADFPLQPDALAAMVRMIDDGRITGRLAKDLFAALLETRRNDPEALARERGWEVVRDDAAVEKLLEELVAANPKEVEKFRAGKMNVLGFFVGQVMKGMGGKADPKVVNELARRKLQG